MQACKIISPGRRKMPYINFPDGLYLIKKRTPDKRGNVLYGICDIGGITEHLQQLFLKHPVVYLKVGRKIKTAWLCWLRKTGEWEIAGKVKPADLPTVRKRLVQAVLSGKDDLFKNNHRQFAKFITKSKYYGMPIETKNKNENLPPKVFNCWLGPKSPGEHRAKV
jgi:hypothetical protein